VVLLLLTVLALVGAAAAASAWRLKCTARTTRGSSV